MKMEEYRELKKITPKRLAYIFILNGKDKFEVKVYASLFMMKSNKQSRY